MPFKKAEDATQLLTQGGAALATGSGLTTWLSENYELMASIGVVVGIFVGVTGLAFNIYFGWRRVKHTESRKG